MDVNLRWAEGGGIHTLKVVPLESFLGRACIGVCPTWPYDHVHDSFLSLALSHGKADLTARLYLHVLRMGAIQIISRLPFNCLFLDLRGPRAEFALMFSGLNFPDHFFSSLLAGHIRIDSTNKK